MQFQVEPASRGLDTALRQAIDNKTKPLGSLGRIEALALQLGRIQQTLLPTLRRPHIVVCAGDHGAAKAGISAYPQEVTWQMVENFLAGGAAINVFARANGLELIIVDCGVAHDFGERPGLIDAKVSAIGTASYLDGAAMTMAQCETALANGARIVAQLDEAGCNVVGFGEMGIGNTASASLISHCLTGAPLADCVGRGTGLDDAGLARKRQLLQQALDVWLQRSDEPLAVLARYGGFEIATMAGGMLEAARRKMLVLVDGFISGAAALIAAKLAPAFLDYAVFSHLSQERGHQVQLAHLGARPLIDLDLRLGEGTGAALAWPLVKSASAMLGEMASFAEAGVAERL
nr:nicotinate-nucleotide--dimethylbenzimidazole phosphoribosyltransferase [Sulfuricystis thermophila]